MSSWTLLYKKSCNFDFSREFFWQIIRFYSTCIKAFSSISMTGIGNHDNCKHSAFGKFCLL